MRQIAFREVLLSLRFWEPRPRECESLESRFPPGTRTGEGAASVRVFVEAARQSRVDPLPEPPSRAPKADKAPRMDIHVEYDPSVGGEPEPGVVWFGARRLVVQAIVERWHGSDRRWWKLQTQEGLYMLRRDGVTGEWELAAVVGA